MLDLVAGSAAGASAVMLTYPMDLVRTRLAYMTEAGGSRHRGSSGSSGSSSSSAGGGAVRLGPAGAGAALPAAAAASSSSTGASGGSAAGSRLLMQYGRAASGAAVLASSRGRGSTGSGGGGLPSVVGRLQGRGAPLRMMHEHAAALALGQQQGLRHTIRSVLSATLRKEGIRGLYHGVGASMYGILPYAGLKFYTYQHLKQARRVQCGRGAKLLFVFLVLFFVAR